MSNYVIYSNSYNAKELGTSLPIRDVFFLLNVTNLKKNRFFGHKFIYMALFCRPFFKRSVSLGSILVSYKQLLESQYYPLCHMVQIYVFSLQIR